jgi:hypothetical protein
MSSGSMICSPIGRTGLSEVIGSWKIIEISRPRRSRIRSSSSINKSRPSKRMRPCGMRAVRGNSRITPNPDTDFPEPDSPTSATISPGRT